MISFDAINDWYDPKLKKYRLGVIENIAKTGAVKHMFIKGQLAGKTILWMIWIKSLYERFIQERLRRRLPDGS